MILALVLLFVLSTKSKLHLNWSTLLWVVYYASIGSALIPISAYFFAGKKNRLRNIMFILLMASLVSDVGSWIYALGGHRGYLISNIFIVCQITLLCLVYVKMLTSKTIVRIALWAFPFLAFGYSIFFQSINEFQSGIRVLGAVLMISFAFRYFWQMYCYLPADDLSKFLKGWINIAVFCYFSFNLFLFTCANYVFNNESTVVAMAFWSFHNLNNIIKNCLLAFGLYNGTEAYPADPDN